LMSKDMAKILETVDRKPETGETQEFYKIQRALPAIF
jgi:hypothetical protein